MKYKKYYMNWYQYDYIINFIVDQIKSKRVKNMYSQIFTFPLNGYIPAVHLAKLLNIKKIIINSAEIDQNTLIVDDISDSGETLNQVYDPKLDVVCICYKEGTIIKPSFSCLAFEKNIWVVFPWELKNSKEKRDLNKDGI